MSFKRKKKNDRNDRFKARTIMPVIIILFLGLLTFLLFGGDKVPERIRNLKGYSNLTGTVRDKLPGQ